MRKILFISVLFCLIAGGVSAKKVIKTTAANCDTVASVVCNDTARADFIFPMITVGDVRVSTLAKKQKLEVDSLNASDSILFQGLDKKQIVDFFVQNVVYPNELKQKAAEDYLKIRFEVDKEGNVKNPKVVDAMFPEMEKEVLRVVEKLPKPTTENNASDTAKKSKRKDKSKDTTVEIPISFRLLRL